MKTKVILTALSVALLATSPALAGNGHGKGNGNGNSNGAAHSGGGSSNGKMASELKGLNAYHANENAFENANPESQVGRIATYQDAAQATIDAQANLDSMTAPTRSLEEIQAEMDALDPNSATYEEDLAALQAEYDNAVAYAEAEAAVADAQAAEDAALLEASNDRVLSDEALAFFREQLGL